MAYTNNDPVTGPALVTYDGKKHQALDDISISFRAVDSPIVTALDGEVNRSLLRHDLQASYTPDGRWNADTLAVLFPYRTHRRGQSCELSGTADTPLRLDGIDGQYHSILRAVLTEMPSISFAVDRPAFGSVTWEGLCARGKDPEDAASYYTPTMTGSSVTDTTFNPDDLVRGNFLLTCGGLEDIEAQDGWTFTPSLSTQEIIVAGVKRRIVFESLSATITGIPANIDADDLIDELLLQNDSTIVPGRSVRSLAGPVSIELGGTVYLYAPKCTLINAGQEFGAARLRNGEIGFQLTRDFSSGAPAALWAWDAPPPPPPP
jgi:hypothetical protein